GHSPEPGKDVWCGSWKIFSPDGSLMLPDSCSMAIALREKREVEPEEIVISRPDGSRVNVLSSPRPLFDKAGEIQGAICLLTDITSEKAKAAELRELSGQLEENVERRARNFRKSEE